MLFNPSVHKLSNGLAVLLDPMDIATTSMAVSIGIGARNETPAEYGITHFLEHMLMKGTSRFPSAKQLKDNIHDNGGISNAGTGARDTRFYGRMLAENFHVLAESISDQLRNSLFDENVLNNERTVILDELRRSMDMPRSQFRRHVVDNLFADSGLAHDTLGTEENIKNFTCGQMKEYMQKCFSAKNTIIGISGKIADAGVLLELLENLYGWIPVIDVAPPVPAKVCPCMAHKLKPEQKNIKLVIGFQDVWPNMLEFRYQNICVDIFERSLSRRIYDNVRNKAGLVYGIGMSSVGDEFVTVNTIETECAPDKIAEVVSIMAKTANEIMSAKPVDITELERARIMKKFAEANFLESADDRNDRLIGFYRKFGLVYDIADYWRMIERVSPQDIAEYSRDYFSLPISVLTMGSDFDTDLKHVWKENFQS